MLVGPLSRDRFRLLVYRMMLAFGSGEKGSARRFYRYRRLYDLHAPHCLRNP